MHSVQPPASLPWVRFAAWLLYPVFIARAALIARTALNARTALITRTALNAAVIAAEGSDDLAAIELFADHAVQPVVDPGAVSIHLATQVRGGREVSGRLRLA